MTESGSLIDKPKYCPICGGESVNVRVVRVDKTEVPYQGGVYCLSSRRGKRFVKCEHALFGYGETEEIAKERAIRAWNEYEPKR